MSQIASFYLIKNNQRQELSDGDCSGAVYMTIWDSVSYTHLRLATATGRNRTAAGTAAGASLLVMRARRTWTIPTMPGSTS